MYPHAIFLADPYTLDKDIEQALLFFFAQIFAFKKYIWAVNSSGYSLLKLTE